MFEQSMLFATETGKRTSAVAVSCAMQAIAVGLIALIPVIWGDRLSLPRPLLLVPIPLVHQVEPEPVKATPAPHESRSIVPRIFRMTTPQRVPTTPVLISDDATPSLPSAFNTTSPAISPSVNLPTFSDLVRVTPPPAKPASEPVRAVEAPHAVGGDVQAAKLIRKVIPIYPELAKRARVSGTVRLVGVIAKDGTIERLQVISGPALLVKSALDAVRQWVYKPTLLNGTAVEVTAPIDVIFTLSQ